MVIFFCYASEHVDLIPIKIDRHDIAAKQRGAQVFFNYCSGCHSLKYVRFSDLARDLKIFNQDGVVDKKMILSYLNFVNDDYRSNAINAMSSADAQQWFGKAPPDLSLETRVRGTNWIYTFLKSFYLDTNRPMGVNNLLYPNVAMPHVLIELQGLQKPIYNDDHRSHVIGLTPDLKTTPAQLERYDRTLKDLVTFLDYVSEPHKQERLDLGRYVILFLVLFVLTSYLYYHEVWKDVD
jgi:ubiquinol-cytochrome c reductase cytochrome c1 subunit